MNILIIINKKLIKKGEIMKAYWIALYKRIDNQENLKNYGSKVTAIIKSYGGKPLVRGGKFELRSAVRTSGLVHRLCLLRRRMPEPRGRLRGRGRRRRAKDAVAPIR